MGAFTSATMRAIGAPCWFPLAHAEAIAAHPDLELAALCDANPDSLARAQAEYGVTAGYTDVEALAREARPDLVGIATRTIDRAAIIETLFAHGTRAFHIEKPLCNSVAELHRLEAILGRDDVFATYGAIRRYFAIYREAVALAHSGELGELLEVRANFGPGALYWVQPHTVDLILFAARGRAVEGVQARLVGVESGATTAIVENDPLVAAATIWFEGGLAGHIGRAPGYEFALSCTKGEIVVRRDGWHTDLYVERPGNPYLVAERAEPGAAAVEGILAPIAQLAACLSGDADAIAENRGHKRDILVGQAISFAMVESHFDGSRISPLAATNPDTIIRARTNGNYA